MWELKGLPYWGKRATYNGGGFIAELPLSQLKMKRFLNKLKEARYTYLLILHVGKKNKQTKLLPKYHICFFAQKS